jgi:lambda repressor-like predicted transcriptional regulator
MTDPIAMLRERQNGKSLRALAREIPCSVAYLSDVLATPPKRAPGPTILKFLGLQRHTSRRTSYRRVRSGADS